MSYVSKALYCLYLFYFFLDKKILLKELEDSLLGLRFHSKYKIVKSLKGNVIYE